MTTSTPPSPPHNKKRIILIGAAGASCSGKTTLVKILSRIIPQSLILHQDDFAPPEALVPYHEVWKELQDWDKAPTAILWDKQRAAIHYLKQHGTYPPNHSSHDHLNSQTPVPVNDKILQEWKEKFNTLIKEVEEEEGEEVKFVICDGFLMLYDIESVKEFDVRMIVRESYQVCKERREIRSGYHTGEGEYWKDPPDYWDKIVYPAYVEAHKNLFLNEDVESGLINEKEISGLVLLEGRSLSIEEMVNEACQAIYDRVKSGKGSKDWEKP